ncbi:MAG TPA: VOC family protein [Acidimicrobiales bacterium]|nr:VOC family protein [Acidimicrobiales bacterium]
MSVVFNHIGLCVTDLAASRRFYEEVFGFEFLYEMQPPDDVTGRLLGLDGRRLGMTAAYLRLEGFTLELLHFAPEARGPFRSRVMNEPGLTHLSVSVDDVPATLARVPDLGGTVLFETDLAGLAIMVRDPDGQLIEVLPMSYREALEAQDVQAD